MSFRNKGKPDQEQHLNALYGNEGWKEVFEKEGADERSDCIVIFYT